MKSVALPSLALLLVLALAGIIWYLAQHWATTPGSLATPTASSTPAAAQPMASSAPTVASSPVPSAPFVCGQSTVKDADGNVYHTVEIGTQCWMNENMRVGTRVNLATNQTNNGTIEYWCFNDDPANCTSNDPNYPDGGLYQWNEAMQYSTTPGAQGICPGGWHIPTHDEFTTLERAVCTSGTCATDFPYDTITLAERGTNEGTQLQPNGTSGFEGNLAGVGGYGSFINRGVVGYFWSSSGSGDLAWGRQLESGGAQVARYTSGNMDGFSVRCLKNA